LQYAEDNLFEFIAEQLESNDVRLFLYLDYMVCVVHICMHGLLRMNVCTIICIMNVRHERKEDRER
jgi:hypothetical protein